MTGPNPPKWGEIQEETMRRIASCVVLAVFLASASKVAAQDDDKVTPPLKAGGAPAAKPNDSDKSAAKGSETRITFCII